VFLSTAKKPKKTAIFLVFQERLPYNTVGFVKMNRNGCLAKRQKKGGRLGNQAGRLY
jgi:isoaspartyl peptidase/L-asparaginase-like protein (Ntn-hydrolase superfamily)